MKLLKELTNPKFLIEADELKKSIEENNGKFIVKGVIQRADAENQNGRIYPKDVIVREIENYKKLVAERRAHGCLDHDDSPVVNLKDTSHIITDIWMEPNGDVMGKIEVLRTPMGMIVRSLIEDQVTVGISSRALGSVESMGGIDYVQDDLHFICWDFVSEPSTHGAFMFKEARDVTKEELKKVFSREDKIDRAVNKLLEFKKQ